MTFAHRRTAGGLVQRGAAVALFARLEAPPQHRSRSCSYPTDPPAQAIARSRQGHRVALCETLALQSIPFASIVRCLVALVARRRTTASSAGTVGHRASTKDGTPPSRRRMLRALSPRAKSD